MSSETISEVLVFKTNIANDTDVETISVALQCLVNIHRWNVDVQDVDHVLRVECDTLEADVIINVVSAAGFICEELPD